MAPRPPVYLIFRGPPEGPALWLEAAYSLELAKRRMWEIAGEQPGIYFLSNLERIVLAGINTGPTPIKSDQTSHPAKRAAA